MKSVLLGKHHDITAFSSKDASRYSLISVHYNAAKKLVEATNGRILIRIPVVESEDFPPLKTPQSDKEPQDAIIPPEPFAKALATAAKQKSSLPVLNYAKLESNGEVRLTTTDLENEQTVNCRPIDATYPNCDAVWPTYEPKLKIQFDAKSLKPIIDYAIKHGQSSDGKSAPITFSFKDSLSPGMFKIEIEDLAGKNEATGLIMPMRMS